MEILVNLDVMMAKRKISAGELAERVGITPANLSILKNNKAKAIRFSTLMALCRELQCQPGDLLEFVDGPKAAEKSPNGMPNRAPLSILHPFYRKTPAKPMSPYRSRSRLRPPCGSGSLPY